MCLPFLTRGSCWSGDHSCFPWLPLDFWHFSTLPASWVVAAAEDTIHPLSSQLCPHTHMHSSQGSLRWRQLLPQRLTQPKGLSWDSLCVVSWRELVGSTPYVSIFNLSAPQWRHQSRPSGLPHCPFPKPDLNRLIS